MASWYVGSTKWSAVTQWAALTSYSVGDLRRQLATPAVGSERVFRCTTAGMSGVAEPSWTLTKGGTTNDGTAVWTEVTGNSTYGWAAAHARLASALSWSAAGDIIYVSNNHAETQSTAITLTPPGTAASPNQILCVDDSATPPTTLATTATISTTGGTAVNVASGYAYIYGLTITHGSGASGVSAQIINSGTASGLVFDTCTIAYGSTNSGNTMQFGLSTATTSQYVTLINTKISFANAGQTICVRCPFRWENTASAIQGTAPTTLFTVTAAGVGWAVIRGVDLSALGSGSTLYAINQGGHISFYFEDCKLGSSVAITSGSVNGPVGKPRVLMVNCDSADTNYRYYKQDYNGTITQETTIVRTGGATDGTTPISRKMVSSANTNFWTPLESDWITYRANSTGSTTITVPVITDNVTLTDADAWVEVEYLGTSGTPLGVFASDRATNIMATPANQTTDSTSSWTTTGLTTPVKQSLSVTFTPVKVGPIRARVCLAKASTTMYVDPLISAGSRQWQAADNYLNDPASIAVNRGLMSGGRI